MKIKSNILGIIIFLLGTYLALFEIGMALSEMHTFEWSGVFLVALFVGLGIGMMLAGIKLMKSWNILGISLYIFAAFLLYIIYSDPKPEGGNLLKLPCLFFPLLLIIGGTLLLKKKRQKNK